MYQKGRWGKNQEILEQDCKLLYNFIDQQDNIIEIPQVTPMTDFLILLVSNSLKLPNFIVFLLE